MGRLAAGLFALLALVPAPARAMEAPVSGVELTLSYQEPTLNADRSPLRDLKKTTVYWHWKGSPRSVTKAAEVPATKPAGGGTVRVRILIPVGASQEKEVTVYTTASDEKGNESGRSNEVTARIDRLPPAPRR